MRYCCPVCNEFESHDTDEVCAHALLEHGENYFHREWELIGISEPKEIEEKGESSIRGLLKRFSKSA